MIRSTILASCFFAAASLAPLGKSRSRTKPHLRVTPPSLLAQNVSGRQIPRDAEPANPRAYMQRLTARPHHVGSPYDKDNADDSV
jgi:N-acetylated-alpha-linked acidic dipeptidase